MKKPNEKTSPAKENKKVRTDKQFKDDPVREAGNNSICKDANNKSAYPYKQKHDKQYDNQAEFIDRDSESKDKS